MGQIVGALALIAVLFGCCQSEPLEAPSAEVFDTPMEAAYEAPQEEFVQDVQEEAYEPQEATECEIAYEPSDWGYWEPEQQESEVGYPYEAEGYDPEAEYTEQAPVFSGGLTPQSGVNYHDGRTETYYSSNVLYHYRTNEWTVDDEGFYRTDEGYYVVAASDMEQGTTFETSKGTAIVLDSGCSNGVTDFYVNW